MTTLLDDLKDALHRAYARLFPQRVTHNARARHHLGARAGRGIGISAAALVAREAAYRALRAECDRMAQLLDGARRGRGEAVFFRGRMRREVATAMRRMPARARFAGATAVGHVRTAGRETVAAAALVARQVGAHRHVKGVNDAAHTLAAYLLAEKMSFAARRAVGENSIWTRGGLTA